MQILGDKDVFVLCGGLGKRLRSKVKDIPKVLAEIDGKPFLGILIDYLAECGFKKAVLGIGYKGEMIEDFVRGYNTQLSIAFSKEEEPLGTGGAVKHAREHIQSEYFFALNGDCFCRFDYASMFGFHIKKCAHATLAVTELKERSDFGSITLDDNDKIIDFSEKSQSAQTRYVNVGIYCFSKDIFDFMPDKKSFSIETEFFPTMVDKDFYGFKTDREFIDIGTPERYKAAAQFLKKKGN